MISEKIKYLRDKYSYTQSELAKKLGITRSSVNAWEMGISAPSTQYLVDMANLFKVSTDFLLDLSNDLSVNISRLTEDEKDILFSMLKYFNRNKKS